MSISFDNSWRFGLGCAQGVGGIIFLIGAIALYFFSPPPVVRELKAVSGTLGEAVQAHRPGKGGSWADISILTPDGKKCVSIQNIGHLWKKEAGHPLLELKPGAPLTVLLREGESVVWEVRSSELVVLPYSATYRADLEPKKRMMAMGLLLLVLSAPFLLWSWWRQRKWYEFLV
jgi:hypothetical protein